MKSRLIILILTLLSTVGVVAQTATLRGIVTDSITGEGLGLAPITIDGTSVGTTTDLDGRFAMSIDGRRTVRLHVSYMGYNQLTVVVTPDMAGAELNIRLSQSTVALGEVVVTGKEKYDKNNPAVDFVRHVIGLRNEHTPRQHDYYSYDHYERIIFAQNEFVPKPRTDGKKRRFDFVREYVDTLDTGTTILPVSEKEKISTVIYRRQPRTEREIVRGFKSAGIDDILSSDGVHQVLTEVFKEVDIFQNDVPLFLQRFVSPLSSHGPNFYKYFLRDTVVVNGTPCIDLEFYPFTPEGFGFMGHLYVVADSTYFIKRAELNVSKKINLNFVSRMSIVQEFERTPDSTRLITRNDVRVNFKITEKSSGLYAQRLNIYSNHSFDPPADSIAAYFAEKSPVINLQDSRRRDDDFWEANRPEEAAKRNPNSVEKFMARLNEVPIYKIAKQAMSTIVSGYVPTNNDPEKSKFEFGPVNTIVNNNPLEGLRVRIGGTTTPAFSRHLFLDGYVAYGFKDEKVKYNGLVEYSFIPRKLYRKEFPVHSLRLEYSYDINKLGQEYMFTSQDNMVMMIRRQEDKYITYQRRAELTYTQEFYNGFSYNIIANNWREYSTRLVPFERYDAGGAVAPIGHYDMTTMELKLRYAKDEKFYQTRNWRIPITFDALIVNLSHVMGWKNFLGTDYNYQRTELGLQKRFWFSAYGYIDIIARAGKVWTRVPYPLLILPNANMTYTIQPETYTNMNALEFINDEYVSWDITYYLNGNLLNRIPLIKKLKWREVISFRGLLGNLTDKNNPAKQAAKGQLAFPATTCTMGKTPYMEMGVGIENILKIMRIDYVWRLTYRDNPDIQNGGVRITMRMSF